MVWKDNQRVEAYGTVDELNSFLGNAKQTVKNREIESIIENIQGDLFRVCAELADGSSKYKKVIGEPEIRKLRILKKDFLKEYMKNHAKMILFRDLWTF